MDLLGSFCRNKAGISYYVPCLNEYENIADSIDTIILTMKSFPFDYEILIFDDGSTDGTPEHVKEIIKKLQNIQIRLVENKNRKGVGANYLAGAKIATYEFYMQVNGDNDSSESTIGDIICHLGEADMIIPYLGDNDIRGLKRRAISRGFVKLVNIINGTNLPYYNGLTLHRTENIKTWPYESVDGIGFLAELLCELLRKGKSYKLVKTCPRFRLNGKSKAMRIYNFVSVFKSLFRIFLRRINYQKYILRKQEI